MHMSMEIVWHDFDRARRIIRVAFVSEDRIMGIKYQLCPKCGVTMAEEDTPSGKVYSCDLCGAEIAEA